MSLNFRGWKTAWAVEFAMGREMEWRCGDGMGINPIPIPSPAWAGLAWPGLQYRSTRQHSLETNASIVTSSNVRFGNSLNIAEVH